MKILASYILNHLLWLVSKIYTYTFSARMERWRNIIYTMWIRNFIGYVGDKVIIERPCKLQGKGYSNISIGKDTNIRSYTVLGCWKKYDKQEFSPSISIGSNCNIGEYNHITAINRITIGDGLLTGRFVYIGDNAHGSLSLEEADIPPAKRHLVSKGEIVIGNNVWIGDKATVLPGVRIGDNVIIASNAVVTHDVPSNTLVAGVPAEVVRSLY